MVHLKNVKLQLNGLVLVDCAIFYFIFLNGKLLMHPMDLEFTISPSIPLL